MVHKSEGLFSRDKGGMDSEIRFRGGGGVMSDGDDKS